MGKRISTDKLREILEQAHVFEIYGVGWANIQTEGVILMVEELLGHRQYKEELSLLLSAAKTRIALLEQQLQKAKLRAVQRKTELKKERSKK